MRLTEDGEKALSGAMVVALLLACMAFAWWRAGQKAAAYERATGVRVTTWDAMFLDLRVDGAPKAGGR